MNYRSSTVTDLNRNNTGGVPALFKSFTVQARVAGTGAFAAGYANIEIVVAPPGTRTRNRARR